MSCWTSDNLAILSLCRRCHCFTVQAILLNFRWTTDGIFWQRLDAVLALVWFPLCDLISGPGQAQWSSSLGLSEWRCENLGQWGWENVEVFMPGVWASSRTISQWHDKPGTNLGPGYCSWPAQLAFPSIPANPGI